MSSISRPKGNANHKHDTENMALAPLPTDPVKRKVGRRTKITQPTAHIPSVGIAVQVKEDLTAPFVSGNEYSARIPLYAPARDPLDQSRESHAQRMTTHSQSASCDTHRNNMSATPVPVCAPLPVYASTRNILVEQDRQRFLSPTAQSVGSISTSVTPLQTVMDAMYALDPVQNRHVRPVLHAGDRYCQNLAYSHVAGGWPQNTGSEAATAHAIPLAMRYDDPPRQYAGYRFLSNDMTMLYTPSTRLGSPFPGVLSPTPVSEHDHISARANNNRSLSPCFTEECLQDFGPMRLNDQGEIEPVRMGEGVPQSPNITHTELCSTDPNIYEAGDKSLVDRYLHSLTPNLADKDPFQAAMGLVYLSKLGLEWDYS